jgi:hypothetical protein
LRFAYHDFFFMKTDSEASSLWNPRPSLRALACTQQSFFEETQQIFFEENWTNFEIGGLLTYKKYDYHYHSRKVH